MKCSECGGGCYRRECLPAYQEDRLRMYRNPNTGDRYSYSLGQDMPETRRERDALAKQKGLVFCSPSDNVSPEHQAAAEYHKAVEQGASHAEAERVAPWPKPPKRSLKTYVDKWAASKTDWTDIRLRDD